MARKAASEAIPAVIRADEVYGLDEFLKRMRWGRHSLKSARDQGLRTVKKCKNVYVLGSDVIAFLNSEPPPKNFDN